MIKWFQKQIDWEREYDILFGYSQRLEENLKLSLEMNERLTALLEKLNGNK